MKIPFFKTSFGEEEKKAINNCIDSGWVVLGPKTREFEEQFAKYVGALYAVFVDSGTSALFLAMKCEEAFSNGLSFRDRLIETPSLTFVSDPEVVVNLGAKPFFIDVD